jgi:hypothetical protein
MLEVHPVGQQQNNCGALGLYSAPDSEISEVLHDYDGPDVGSDRRGNGEDAHGARHPWTGPAVVVYMSRCGHLFAVQVLRLCCSSGQYLLSSFLGFPSFSRAYLNLSEWMRLMLSHVRADEVPTSRCLPCEWRCSRHRGLASPWQTCGDERRARKEDGRAQRHLARLPGPSLPLRSSHRCYHL